MRYHATVATIIAALGVATFTLAAPASAGGFGHGGSFGGHMPPMYMPTSPMPPRPPQQTQPSDPLTTCLRATSGDFDACSRYVRPRQPDVDYGQMRWRDRRGDVGNW
jgi:hypothetical protein